MLNKFTDEEMSPIFRSFFDDIQANKFEITKTVKGSPAIIMSRIAGGDKPLMGVYWSGDEWVPTKWCEDGRYISNEHPRSLDLDITTNTGQAA